jgi:predicted transcriptional regulator
MELREAIRTGKVGELRLDSCTQVQVDTPIREVLARLRSATCGVALVCEDQRLVGIFTNRDVLRKIVGRPETLDRPVREYMTASPRTVTRDATLSEALRVMTQGRFRDLPILNADGRLIGNLTHDAVVQFLADHFQAEVINLPPDPDQVMRSVEGA